MTKSILFISSFLLLVLVGCSTSKNIPDGQYLLNSIGVKHDTHNATSDLEAFVPQQPNVALPLFGKVRLRIYNMAGQDTSKWLNRTLQNMGQAPVIYSEKQVGASINQLRKQLNNQGYLNAEVDTTLKEKGNKIDVTYHIKGGTPYRIRNYVNQIDDSMMMRIFKLAPLKPLVATGDMFDLDMLEQERLRINKILRNAGYYNFSKEFVYFKADTTLHTHQADIFLSVYPAKDSLPYPRYKIDNVTIVSGINSVEWVNETNPKRLDRLDSKGNRLYFRNQDTTIYRDMTIIHGRRKFLTPTSIYRNNYLHKGQSYTDYKLTDTYEAFNKMEAIKQVSITMLPSPKDSLHLLDAVILLSPANAHWFKASMDGTNSAGDFGIAPSITYQHQNLFNGGEQLSVRLKGAYEFIGGGKTEDILNQSYYEYGLEGNLTFPFFLIPFINKSSLEQPSASSSLALGLNVQNRPEYTRQFFNAALSYGWVTSTNRMRHNLDLLDANFVRMPWVSDLFKDQYLNNPNNQMLVESYRDQMIARTSYTNTLVNERRFNPLSPSYVLRSSIEVAGALPRLSSAIFGARANENNQKEFLGVAYAEYIKGSFDFTRTFYYSKKHSLAYNIELGLAYPYGNSTVLPFERRFFAGGANSVRGWSTRALGPGSYRRSSKTDFINQAGDMKLQMSIENRHKVTNLIELAEFIDAGNIWTLKQYDNQVGGQFRFDSFYKEIAVAYGVGLRFDLDFLIIRFDLGARAYDPGEESNRFVLLKPRLSRMAWHFGIGYPF